MLKLILKMDKKDIKHFMKFLEEKLFVDRKQFQSRNLWYPQSIGSIINFKI